MGSVAELSGVPIHCVGVAVASAKPIPFRIRGWAPALCVSSGSSAGGMPPCYVLQAPGSRTNLA
jgi:hypothetical protein